MLLPLSITASLLSEVVIFGVESILAFPVASNADKRRSSWVAPVTLPSVALIAPPIPKPAAAGRLTALVPTELPVTATVFGKLTSDARLNFPPHSIPSSFEKSGVENLTLHQ